VVHQYRQESLQRQGWAADRYARDSAPVECGNNIRYFGHGICLMGNERAILTVSELTRQIKFTLESGFPRVWVQGEISNFKQHTSGHLYFTLKDEGAQLSAVLWRSRALSLTVSLKDGMKVIARGSITVYPPRGNYQIDVEQVQPLGIGELQVAFERLKQKLHAEGLFALEHKKPIPEYPERIGIITSETGAALQDIKSVLSRRQPSLEVVLLPVRVQGAGAAEEIAAAIEQMNRYGKIDVLIVGRGGGSLEDLWAFNEEIVARAIFASRIPVISAVGHEVDFSIADFVADLRAPTPSAAAELVVRHRNEILDNLRNLCYTMSGCLNNQVVSVRERIASLLAGYSFNRPRDLTREMSQRLDELDRSLGTSFSHLTQVTRYRHEALVRRLEALSPRGVLRRGYAIVRKQGRIVSSVQKLIPNDKADIEFHDGAAETRVEEIRHS
jgi:exodeoxyribonuclease VII large subunit